MQVYASMGFQLLIFGIWFLKCCILLPTKLRHPKRMCRETCWMTQHQENKPTATLRLQFSTTILNCVMFVMLRRTRSLLDVVRCSTFLRITKQWLKWSSRAGVLQWDMFPGLTELFLIGSLTESIWIQRFKSNTSTPNTNSQTSWPKVIFTRDEWNNLLH